MTGQKSLRAIVMSTAMFVASCSSPEPQTEAKLGEYQAEVCEGQRAVVPASGTIDRVYDVEAQQSQRSEMAAYVSYSVQVDELRLYVSFAPGLPAHPTTAEIRAAFQYANVNFDLDQPDDVGGNLQVLSSSNLLALADFQQFEIVDGRLAFSLLASNRGGYTKWLTIYDKDPSNDPPDGARCATDDILGMCPCDFSGPPLELSLSGRFPL